MFDQKFIERVKQIYPQDFQAVLDGFHGNRLPIVRVNTLVVEESIGVEKLRELGFEPKKLVEGKNVYVLEHGTKRNLTDSDEFKNGWFYIQSASSMVPVWCLEEEIKGRTRNGEDLMVLDMCAAPGSKTTQFAAAMENKGQIIACDVSRQRLYMLKSNLDQQHVTNVAHQLTNTTQIWKKYGPMFDYVLLDAPCSGEGRFKSDDAASYEDWSMKKVERLASEQRRLMFAAAMSVKSGGALIYSTCTMAPEENEEIVQFVLEKFDGSFDVEDIDLTQRLGTVAAHGLTRWEDTTLPDAIANTLRIKPNEFWEGFFVCVLRRL